MIARVADFDVARFLILAAIVFVALLLLYRRLRLYVGARGVRAVTGGARRGARHQVGALPVRSGARGEVEVLVISTRGNGSWTVPKGWPMRGRSDAAAAAQEAYEEAGVRGTIASEPLGTFEYVKRGRERETLVVTVYRLEVSVQARRWRERGQRTLRWLPVSAAAQCVRWPGLADIIRSLETRSGV